MEMYAENLDSVKNVTEEKLLQILDTETFGGFIGLEMSDDTFLQASIMDEPAHPETMYYVEYKSDGKIWAATSQLTKNELKQAFTEYLQGNDFWKGRYAWEDSGWQPWF